MKRTAPARPEVRDLGLVRRVRDDDEEGEIQRPLEWSLIRRLFTYAAPVRPKVVALGILTVIRAAQLYARQQQNQPATDLDSLSVLSSPRRFGQYTSAALCALLPGR